MLCNSIVVLWDLVQNNNLRRVDRPTSSKCTKHPASSAHQTHVSDLLLRSGVGRRLHSNWLHFTSTPPMQLHSPSCPLNSTFELLLKNCAFELLLRTAVQLFSFPTLEDHLLSALSTLVQIQCTVCAQLIMSKMPNIDINKVHFTSSPCNCTLAFRPLCSFAFFSSLENCSRLISHLATTSEWSLSACCADLLFLQSSPSLLSLNPAAPYTATHCTNGRVLQFIHWQCKFQRPLELHHLSKQFVFIPSYHSASDPHLILLRQHSFDLYRWKRVQFVHCI